MSQVVQALATNHLELRSAGPKRFYVTRAATPPVPVAPVAVPAPNEVALEEVSVFASRYAFTSGTDGEPIEIDRQKMEQVPGAQSDAVQALRTAPGLATNLSARPYIRGALLDDVLVQYDGITLIDPFHFKSFQSLLSAFDPSSVGGAEVYTGGFPVHYGTRSAGVIDLAPRSVDSGYEYGVGASLLSYNLESVGHAEQWPLDWLLTARHNTNASVLQPIEGESGEPTFSDAIGRIRWQLGSASAVTLGGLLLDDRVHLSSNSSEEQASASSTDQHVWLAWDWAPTDALQSHTSFAVSRSERDLNGDLNLSGIANGRLDEERSFSTLDLRSAWQYAPSAALSWDLGAEWGLEKATLDFSRQEILGDLIAASFGRSPNAAITSTAAPQAATLGLFSSVRRHWKRFEAELGLRLDGQDYHGFGTRSQLSPRINLRYDATAHWHLYGSWGQFAQAQRVDEYRSEEDQSTPDSATRAMHLIAGVAHESAGTRWRVEAYRNQWSSISPYFDNALGAVSLLPELEPDRVLVTPRDTETTGIEFSAQRPFGPHFNAWGTYMLLESPPTR